MRRPLPSQCERRSHTVIISFSVIKAAHYFKCAERKITRRGQTRVVSFNQPIKHIRPVADEYLSRIREERAFLWETCTSAAYEASHPPLIPLGAGMLLRNRSPSFSCDRSRTCLPNEASGWKRVRMYSQSRNSAVTVSLSFSRSLVCAQIPRFRRR